MLRLLLDHHISPDVLSAARRIQSGICIEHVRERGWQASPDPELLRLARALGRLWFREQEADWLNRTYFLRRD